MNDLGRWEWAIGEVLLLVFLLWQLISIRLTLRRDRAARARAKADKLPD